MTLIVGIVSSLLSARVLLTEGTTGIDASQAAASPNHPYYGYMSAKTKEWRKAFFGFYVFHILFFLSTVFSSAVLYLTFGSLPASWCLFAAELVVACGIKGAQGELFGWSVMAAPS